MDMDEIHGTARVVAEASMEAELEAVRTERDIAFTELQACRRRFRDIVTAHEKLLAEMLK